MPLLEGKIALITGSGDGMGRAHAILMAERGADIVVSDIRAEPAQATAEEVRKRGRRAHVVVADMADVAQVKNMAEEGAARLGPIDILVNNAGYGQRLETMDITEEDFDRMFAVHVRGSFFAAQAVIPAMKERRRGKIINISSMWGMTGAPVASHYCAAKAALLGFTKAWAKELAPWNIHVNAVAPGGVRSGGPMKLDNSEILKAKEAKVPLKRYCEPVEIAYAVAYLASPESDFVTGQVISPNGGEVIVGY
ncbi:SDR family NAD(P)-dependent oxidoreductase [Aestuariivirga sp. YIM B02566]|uniref:SDR family oxidoreductase n=1 Tax=Taklimakanibacter albus TaxID=2800327 RepID=A0ACC5R4T7_9HYPH|nr:SDR family NAD(P)-dependent oxidoreductase [Aestuariivirga sp. YIM B02566]MBK1867602.1 SDR family oxidoreductase [Aestuariivirga sp. YIM B02566]